MIAWSCVGWFFPAAGCSIFNDLTMALVSTFSFSKIWLYADNKVCTVWPNNAATILGEKPPLSTLLATVFLMAWVFRYSIPALSYIFFQMYLKQFCESLLPFLVKTASLYIFFSSFSTFTLCSFCNSASTSSSRGTRLSTPFLFL